MSDKALNRKTINLILGGKGGTGKTLFARLLYTALYKANLKVVGIDSDIENPEFASVHSNPEQFAVVPLDFLNISTAKLIYTMLTGELGEESQAFPYMATQCSPDVVVIDMPGGSGHECREQLKLLGLIANSRDLGYQTTVITVLNTGLSPIESLNAMMDFCGEDVQYVAVKSLFWQYSPDAFDRWSKSKTYKRFKKLKGVEIDLPVLPPTTFDALQVRNTSFIDLSGLPLGDRLLAQAFLNRGLMQVADPKVASMFGLLPDPQSQEAAA